MIDSPRDGMTGRGPGVSRGLSAWSAATIVAASMIGVGVFTTSGFALAALGSPHRVVVAWAIAAIVAICGAISYASLARRFARSGGEYLFLAETFHPAAGLTAGWVSLLAGFTGPIAAAALGLESYLAPLLFAPDSFPSEGSIAIMAIVTAAVVHTVGLRGGARLQDIVVLIKLVLIVAFLIYAVTLLGDWSGWPPATPASVGWRGLATTMAGQLVWISFSFAGFNAAVYIAGEIEDPVRNVPRAIIASTLLVSLIYLALNAVFVYSTPLPVLTDGANIDQVAATAARSLGGERLETAVRLVIVTALGTSVLAMVMTGPRVYAKMADDGFLPAWFRFDRHVPAVAIWFQAGLSIVAVMTATLQQWLAYLGLTLSLCSALTVSGLFWLRINGRIDRLPGRGIAPAIFVLASLTFAALMIRDDPWRAAPALVTLGLGAMIYPAVRNRRK